MASKQTGYHARHTRNSIEREYRKVCKYLKAEHPGVKIERDFIIMQSCDRLRMFIGFTTAEGEHDYAAKDL